MLLRLPTRSTPVHCRSNWACTDSNTISPTLGKTSLYAMKIAGIIAFILVAIFMLLVFRLPGLIADISLLGQVGLTFAAVSGFFPFLNSFTLTLPGIAGLILSIGMGVDANIITATRIKEELWAGKTLDSAITQGDENSFSAIFDGNITVDYRRPDADAGVWTAEHSLYMVRCFH